MNVIDYANDSIEAYKKEKATLDDFIKSEIIIPCKKAGFEIKHQPYNNNMFTNRNHSPEDTYIISLKNRKIMELTVHKIDKCFNGSKYILQTIMGGAIICSLYSAPSEFTESKKAAFQRELGIVFGEFLK